MFCVTGYDVSDYGGRDWIVSAFCTILNPTWFQSIDLPGAPALRMNWWVEIR